jgi:hypothetical protein
MRWMNFFQALQGRHRRRIEIFLPRQVTERLGELRQIGFVNAEQAFDLAGKGTVQGHRKVIGNRSGRDQLSVR